MDSETVSKVIIGFLAVIICCSSCAVRAATSSTISVKPDEIQFGDRDIGSSTTESLTVTNSGDAPVVLSVKKSGDVLNDFSWSSSCPKELQSRQSCEIRTVFSPAAIGKDKGDGEDRRATLIVTNDKGEESVVSLRGKAFQNLNVSPAALEFESQIGATSSTARTVQLTNYTNSAVNSITVTATGDFTENHAGCATPLAPGGSCGISVTFSPKQAGNTSGSLTITTNLSTLGKLPRSVALNGLGLNRCRLAKLSLYSWDIRLVVLISGLYFMGLVLVRWHMIAKPARAQLVAEIEAVRSRAVAATAGLPDSPEMTERLARIHFLLDEAIYPFKYKGFPINPEGQGRRALPLAIVPPWHTGPTRFFNALFWTRGQELAGWSLAHEAELQLVALLPAEAVRARLETAEQQLKDMNTPLALALADRVRDALTSGEALMVERATQLIQQFQQLVKEVSATDAARQAWLADLQQRLLNSLQQLGEWAQKNSANAKTKDECEFLLQSFLKAAASYRGLDSDLGKVPDPSRLPSQLGSLLKEIADFFACLTEKIKSAPNIKDEAVTLETCIAFVSDLVPLGNEAGKLFKNLKDSNPPEQVKLYQALLDLCKSQSSLVNTMTQASTPSPASALLHDLLAALQAQTQIIQTINQATAGAGADNFENYRDVVWDLANLPALPSDLKGRIDCLLYAKGPEPLARWRALLVEALSLIYDDTDNNYSQLASWHNKMMWLVGCALLFMFALAVTVGNAVLLLLGAVGGLLSRLTRTTAAADVPNDYGASWGSLFLSPLTGALSAWGGILLIILGLKLNVLGAALNLDWCNPYEPVGLAIALLFGFSERLFDSVTNQLQDRLLKSSPPSAGPAATTPGPAAPAPKIASLSPNGATLGQEVQITVRGANFQRGATATVTKDTGESVPAKLEFKEGATVVVTCTPSGGKGFTATLTIVNPDKQAATAKLDVAASR